MIKRKASILVIDDETIILKAFSRELEAAGFAVDTCAGGTQAVSMAQEGQYDIVFVDLVMPNMSGVDICREIKRACPRTQVVLVSGDLEEIKHYQIDFWRAGGRDEILRKPLQENELVNAARAVLQHPM